MLGEFTSRGCLGKDVLVDSAMETMQCRSTDLWQSWSEALAHTGAEEGTGFGGWVARRGRRLLLRPSAGARGVLAHTVSAAETRYMTGHDIKM